MSSDSPRKRWRARAQTGLQWLDQGLDAFERGVLIVGILVMAGMSVGNVVLRNLTGSSLLYANDVTQLLLVVVTFMGLGLGARHARHIRVSAIHDLLPAPARKVLLIITSFSTAGLLLLMAGWAHDYAMSTRRSCRILPETVDLAGLSVPVGGLAPGVAVGLLLLLMVLFGQLILRVPRLATRLRARLSAWAWWLSCLVAFAVIAAAAVWLSGWAAELVASRSGRCRVMSSTGLPVYLVHLVVPLGFLLGAIQFGMAGLRNLISSDNYLSWRRKDEYEPADADSRHV